MDFNIRAISLAGSVSADARIAICELVGKELEFRAGISIRVKLPDILEGFQSLPEPERLLSALDGWTRVYRYPEREGESIHILAPAENKYEIIFYRIDLMQPARSRRGPRPAVEIVNGAAMTYDECAAWLIDLSIKLNENRDQAPRHVVLARPRLLKPKQIRVAWVGPELVDGYAMPPRLRAVGQVYGAEVVYVPIRSYRNVQARLAGALPLDTAVICRHFAPHITTEVVPSALPRSLIHHCDSRNFAELEQQVRTWIEIANAEVEKQRQDRAADEDQLLLVIMLRGMLSHSKIGQFNHCPKATVLTGVRARHLHASVADGLLDVNSEAYQDTKSSNALFLWKEHHDGRQYFLNPQRIEAIKAMVAVTIS